MSYFHVMSVHVTNIYASDYHQSPSLSPTNNPYIKPITINGNELLSIVAKKISMTSIRHTSKLNK